VKTYYCLNHKKICELKGSALGLFDQISLPEDFICKP